LLGINLLNVNDETLLRERMTETTKRLPKGSWITRGDWRAYGAFEENRQGTLAVGKLADIAVLDTDLFETEPAEWLEAGFTHTILGGKIVYEKD